MSATFLNKNFPYEYIAASLKSFNSSYAVLNLGLSSYEQKALTSIVVTRRTSPRLFLNSSQMCSIRSKYHLQSFAHLSTEDLSQRILMRNTHCPTDTIRLCLEKGVRNFAVNHSSTTASIQQLAVSNEVNFFWEVTNDEEALEQLARVSQRSIKGLIFAGKQFTNNTNSVDAITKKVMQMGHLIQTVFLTTKQQDCAFLRHKWVKATANKPIRKMLEVVDCSDVNNYILVAQGEGNNSKVLPEQVRSCVTEPNQINLVSHEGNHYLVSPLHRFPLQGKWIHEPPHNLKLCIENGESQ